MSSTARFSRFAWLTLGYVLLVILWGAWVRITGSGAGCGQNWPTCQGEVVHRPESVEALVELTHRLTSGLTLVLVAILVVWAFRLFPAGHRVRGGAVASGAFLLIEVLIGAGLVLFGLVGDDDSVARAVVMSLHLVNTSLLTGALALTAWWSRDPAGLTWSGRPLWRWLTAAAVAGLLLVNASGAVTALGDTLYPVERSSGAAALFEGSATEAAGVRHFLVQLRIFHPFLAIAVGLYLLALAASALLDASSRLALRRWGWALGTLVVVQLAAGWLNVLLSAPGWMQILHLLLAKLVWLALVGFAFQALRESAPGPAWARAPLAYTPKRA